MGRRGKDKRPFLKVLKGGCSGELLNMGVAALRGINESLMLSCQIWKRLFRETE